MAMIVKDKKSKASDDEAARKAARKAGRPTGQPRSGRDSSFLGGGEGEGRGPFIAYWVTGVVRRASRSSC